MNKMSKISTVLVASLLTISLTACSGTDDTKEHDPRHDGHDIGQAEQRR